MDINPNVCVSIVCHETFSFTFCFDHLKKTFSKLRFIAQLKYIFELLIKFSIPQTFFGVCCIVRSQEINNIQAEFNFPWKIAGSVENTRSRFLGTVNKATASNPSMKETEKLFPSSKIKFFGNAFLKLKLTLLHLKSTQNAWKYTKTPIK